MFLFHIKQAIRFLQRNLRYVFTSVLGLSISLTLIVLLLNYIHSEYHVDAYHSQADRIYRVVHSGECAFSPPFGQYLSDHVDEINAYCRTFCLSGVIKTETNLVQTDRCFYTDSNFFTMFSFPMIAGNPDHVLDSRDNVVLSESFAKILFKEDNPIGKKVIFNGRLIYYVTGITADFNENTHFKPVDVIFPFKAMEDFMGSGSDYLTQYSWRFLLPALYVKTDRPISETSCKTLLADLNKWYWLFSENPHSDLTFQNLKSVYLNPVNYGYEPNVRSGNKTALRLILFIVLAVCVIAFINYINLTISKANNRVSEFCIKRINGAGFKSFAFAIFAEQIIMVFTAVAISIFLIQLNLPIYNKLLGYHLTFGTILLNEFFLTTIALFALLAIITGTSVMLVVLLRSIVHRQFMLKGNSGIGVLQKTLLIMQYTMSISLIISMLVIVKQKHFIEHFNYGFNNTSTLYIKLNREFVGKALVFKSEIEKTTGVKSTSLCNGMPGVGIFNLRFEKEGEVKNIDLFHIDSDYFNTMEISGVSHAELADDECWINQSAAKELDYKESDGFIEFQEYNEPRKLKVKGVLPDMNFHSLYQVAQPTIFSKLNSTRFIDYLLVNIESSQIQAFLSQANQKYNQFSSEFPFEYAFLNDKMNQVYVNDYRTLKLVVWFAIFGIILSSFGMLSLTMLLLISKTKEIGIRKVNGAKVFEVLKQLNAYYLTWISISFVIAVPVAYYLMNQWLKNFAYKTPLSWWIFALAGLLALGIALLTVSFQSWKAATRNPVEALRYE